MHDCSSLWRMPQRLHLTHVREKRKTIPLEVTEQHSNKPSTPASSICHCFSFSPPLPDKRVSHKYPLTAEDKGQTPTLMINQGTIALLQVFL